MVSVAEAEIKASGAIVTSKLAQSSLLFIDPPIECEKYIKILPTSKAKGLEVLRAV